MGTIVLQVLNYRVDTHRAHKNLTRMPLNKCIPSLASLKHTRQTMQ